jgi:hypothetical protein
VTGRATRRPPSRTGTVVLIPAGPARATCYAPAAASAAWSRARALRTAATRGAAPRATLAPATRNKRGAGAARACSAGAVRTLRPGAGHATACEAPGAETAVSAAGCDAMRIRATACEVSSSHSGPRGRRFKSCLPDSEGRDSTRETDGARPSSFPDGALRTTGAPKSVTLGADGAASTARKTVGRRLEGAAAVDLSLAVPEFVAACARLASEAAQNGDLTGARRLLQMALSHLRS